MQEQFSRTELLFGGAAMERLFRSRVAVFGLGGVGGAAAEALARGGIGTMDLFDSDNVSLSNLNRQLIATHATIGRPKVDVMRARILDINPKAHVTARNLFYLPETGDEVDFSQYDYVVDAIDTVGAKIDIAVRCTALGVPVISAMGAGNKLDPTAFRVADVYETKVCPLARVMRRELKKRGVEQLKVVYSEEEPLKPDGPGEAGARRAVPGSTSFVPPVVGFILAGEVLKDLARGLGTPRT